MPEPKYTLEDLSKEEFEAISKELSAVLIKYNCDMGVKSSIEISKRVEIKEETNDAEIVSPYQENGESTNKNEETPETN